MGNHVEQPMLNANSPAYKATSLKGLLKETKENLLVMNWSERGTLLLEVSCLRYSEKYRNDDPLKKGHLQDRK
jgi:hypothetical protein